MSDLIERQAAIDICHKNYDGILDFRSDGRTVALSFEDIINSVPSVQPEPCKSIEDILEYLNDVLFPIVSPGDWNVYSELFNMVSDLTSVQPQRTCVNCGRTANNGGWYADGRTRCPIEEHYALPKDGYCHLWEKRNVTDDDYPERREE